MLVAGCSSSTGSDDSAAADGGQTSAEAGSSPGVAPAKFAKLPQACEALAGKTIEELVPKAKSKSGTVGKSADINSRATCSWNGLDGYQYRWLDVSFQRFSSDLALGSGDSRAKDYFNKQVGTAKSTPDARNLKTGTAAGVGDEATTLSYDLRKSKDDFKNQTIVARTANVVVTLNYNGTGYEDAKPPKAADLLKDAEAAIKKALVAVAKANSDANT
jgi:hypothetical protein